MSGPVKIPRAWREAGEIGPPVDLYETSEAVLVRVAIPGAEGASLSLTILEITLPKQTAALPRSIPIQV